MSSVNGTSNVNHSQAGAYQSNISVENRGGKIHLTATGGNDQIRVSNLPNGMVSVQVNNQQLTFTREQAERLVIHGGDGNDAILLDRNLPKGITVEGGRGNDAILNFSDGARLDGGRGNDTIVNFGRGTSMLGGSGNDFMVQFGDSGAMHGNQGADFMVALGKNNRIYGEIGRDFAADPFGRNQYRAVDIHRSRRHHHVHRRHHGHRTHRSHRHHRRHHARPVFSFRQTLTSISDFLVDTAIDRLENQWYESLFPEKKGG